MFRHLCALVVVRVCVRVACPDDEEVVWCGRVRQKYPGAPVHSGASCCCWAGGRLQLRLHPAPPHLCSGGVHPSGTGTPFPLWQALASTFYWFALNSLNKSNGVRMRYMWRKIALAFLWSGLNML